MKYIIVKVCCFECKKFEDIGVCNKEELIEFFGEVIEGKEKGEEQYNYYIYTFEGDLIFKI